MVMVFSPVFNPLLPEIVILELASSLSASISISLTSFSMVILYSVWSFEKFISPTLNLILDK